MMPPGRGEPARPVPSPSRPVHGAEVSPIGKKPARVRGADAAASADNAPLVLQFKEAVASVLEPFAGASAHPHHGQRVVVGQRLMQPVSDIFLGWTTGLEGRHFYGRRLRDAKIKPLVESFDTDTLLIHAALCGWSLARAHAKSSEVAEIAGDLGASDRFDEAIGRFGLAYADQAERDHDQLKAAVRRGGVTVSEEE